MNSSSIDEASATSYGVSGKIKLWNQECNEAMRNALLAISADISEYADGFLGHIKTILRSPSGWVGMNLIDSDLGVDESGTMGEGPCEFKAMAVALDIDHDTLVRIMHSRLDGVEGLVIIDTMHHPIVPE